MKLLRVVLPWGGEKKARAIRAAAKDAFVTSRSRGSFLRESVLFSRAGKIEPVKGDLFTARGRRFYRNVLNAPTQVLLIGQGVMESGIDGEGLVLSGRI